MQRLIILFFLLPWWAYVPIAGGVAYLGNEVYKHELETEAEREAALDLGAPFPVDLSLFDEDVHIGPAGEVNVLGWINTDYNYTLTKRTNGVKTSERYLYMVFGMGDDPSSRTVRAAIVFTERDKDYFVDHIEDYIVSYQKEEPLFRLGGFASGYDSMSSMVSDAIDEQGLRKADDFFYLEPFLAGREAALAAQGAPELARKQFWAAALAIALLGLAKRVFGWGRKPSEASRAIDPRKAVQVQPPAGANKAHDYDYTFKAKRRDVELSKDISPDSPLGRLATRGAPVQSQGDVAEGAEAAPERVLTGEAEAAVAAHFALKGHFRKTLVRLVLLAVAAGSGVWVVAQKYGQDFAVLAALLGSALLALFALGAVVAFFVRIGSRQKAMRAAGLSMSDLRAILRGDRSVGTIVESAEPEPAMATAADEPEPELAPARPKPARRGTGARALFGLAALLAVIGYLNTKGTALVSLPINGFDPFAQPMPLFAVAGFLMALSVLSGLGASRTPKGEAPQIIPRVADPATGATPQPVQKAAERLSGSRAWVKSAGRGKPSTPTAVNADMRDRMKADPFDRFAEQARALR